MGKHCANVLFLHILFFYLLLLHIRMISKDQFERKKNDVLDPEP